MSDQVNSLVDHLFRREAGKMVAFMTRRFGTENLHLAEDVVQDALGKAMETWPFTGIPENPSAWIFTVAQNRALDLLRRSQLWAAKRESLEPQVADWLTPSATNEAQYEDEIRDSRLRMMFVCCHPGLSREAQVALTLKTLCGFSENEIAAAFLSTPAAIAKRLVRARQFFRDERIPMDIPETNELVNRTDYVLQVLYLLFNEGYKSSSGTRLVREDVCEEAIRLAETLVQHPVGNSTKVYALLALMYFGSARIAGRMDDHGAILLLENQDRSKWDRVKISSGLRWMDASCMGEELSRFHLEAGIAACHCLAPRFEDTDWKHILSLYDSLCELDDSPVVLLNRAIAIGQVEGPAAALEALNGLELQTSFASYYLYPAVQGRFREELGETDAAGLFYRRALELASLPAERIFLENRLRSLSLRGERG